MNAAALLLCALACPPPDALPGVDASDVCRFPPAEVLRQRVRFGGRHLAWLDARAAALGPDWAAREYEYRHETACRLEAWRLALSAAEAADVADRSLCEERLAQLRHRLGVRAYNAGRLPGLPARGAFSRAD